MKKILGLLVFSLFMTGIVSAGNLADIYAKVVTISKIVSHQKGYKVTYYTDQGDLHTIYVPIEWFYQFGNYKTADGFIKAEIVKGNGPLYPYMQIFWENGKFHHLRLFVFERYSHRSWGVVKDSEEAQMALMFDPNKDPDFVF
jgi:hypothetical protein